MHGRQLLWQERLLAAHAAHVEAHAAAGGLGRLGFQGRRGGCDKGDGEGFTVRAARALDSGAGGRLLRAAAGEAGAGALMQGSLPHHAAGAPGRATS